MKVISIRDDSKIKVACCVVETDIPETSVITIPEEIKAPGKRLQHHSSRALLNHLMQRECNVLYDEFKKPFVKEGIHISISHTDEFATIITNQEHATGIDIEKIDPKILKIKNKFASSEELKMINATTETEQLCIIWGAKEALYKLYGKKNIIFKEHLKVAPFQYKKEGNFLAEITKEDFNKKFEIRYHTLHNHILVYVERELLF